MKPGEKPRLRYQPDGDRYIVMLGDERAGFVRRIQLPTRADMCWNAADTFMRKTRNFRTRSQAGAWLQKETERAIAAGEF